MEHYYGVGIAKFVQSAGNTQRQTTALLCVIVRRIWSICAFDQMCCASGKCTFDQSPNHDSNPNTNPNPNPNPNPNHNPIANPNPFQP